MRRLVGEGGESAVLPTFPRNLALVSVLYISERPEMTTHERGL